MSLNNPVWGEGYVPAYQLSAVPFLTASNVTLGQIKEISFQSVSRFFTVKNVGASNSILAVAFTELGLKPVNANYFILSGSESYTGEMKVDRLFLSGVAGTSNFNLIAGLTHIPKQSFLVVTASNGFGSVG